MDAGEQRGEGGPILDMQRQDDGRTRVVFVSAKRGWLDSGFKIAVIGLVLIVALLLGGSIVGGWALWKGSVAVVETAGAAKDAVANTAARAGRATKEKVDNAVDATKNAGHKLKEATGEKVGNIKEAIKDTTAAGLGKARDVKDSAFNWRPWPFKKKDEQAGDFVPEAPAAKPDTKPRE